MSRFQSFLLASAALVGVVMVTSGLVVGRVLEARLLTYEEEQTAQVVLFQARQHLAAAVFTAPLSPGRVADFQTFLEGLPGVFRVKVFDPMGRIVWSNEPRLIGLTFPDNPYVVQALAGRIVTVLEAPRRSEHLYERAALYVAEAYVPITFASGAGPAGVIETYKDVTAVVETIHRTRRLLWAIVGSLGTFLYAALAFVVWRASTNERRAIDRLEAQNRELKLIQQFTDSILIPLDQRGLATSMVESVGAGLDLARAGLYGVARGRDVELLAGWPRASALAPPSRLIAEAVTARRAVVSGTTVALALLPPEGAEYVFVAEFQHAVDDSDLRTLEIMLSGAAIALANVELFTQVRQAHERLAAILTGIADRMLIVDREMRVVWMNAAATGPDAGPETLGDPCFEAFGGDGEAGPACPAVRTFETGRVERGARTQRLADGRVRHLDLVTAPLRDASGRIYQVLEVARDITELVEMEERVKLSAARLEESHAELVVKAEELQRTNLALQETQAQLVEKERLAAVGEVVVGLHHAILNPLTGILGALQVLKQEENVHSPTLQALGEAEAEIRKIERLIRGLPMLRRAAGSPYVRGTTMLDLEPSVGDEPEEPAG